MLFAADPKARVFAIDTHHLFPETYELWKAIEARYDTTIEAFAGEPVEDGLWERNPDLYLAKAKIEPLNRALLDLDCWITGIRRDQSPTRADAPKLGWDEQHELWKANPLADWTDDDCWAYIRERGLPYNSAPRPGLRLDRRHALHRARQGPRGALGRNGADRMRAAHMNEQAQGFVLWFTGPLGRGQDDDLEHRRAGARAARPPRRASRRRHRPHAPLEGPRLLEGGPRHQHRAHRLGRLAHRARRRRRGRLRHLAVRGDAAGTRARSSSSTRRSSRSTSRPRVEECARRDPKGLYAAALRGRDRGVHRRLGSVRGAARPGAPSRDRRPHAARGGGASCSRGSRSSTSFPWKPKAER